MIEIPGGIAIATLHNHVLTKDAFKGKAVTQLPPRAMRCSGRCISIRSAGSPAVIESIGCKQILRLGAEWRPLQRRRIGDMSDLDHPHARR